MRYIKESKYNLYFLIAIISFILSTWYLVPITHELGHVIALKEVKCNYWSHFEYGFFKQFYGEVYNKCDLTDRQRIFVYASGIMLTSLIGIILLIIEYLLVKRNKLEYALITLFLSYSFLMDFVNYLFFPEGDIKEILLLLKMPNAITKVPILGLMILILMITYLYISLHEELNAIILEEKKEVKKLYKIIKKLFK